MRLEPLGDGVEVYVTDTHHFTTDTILLADFASVKNNERVTELGTGCGTIPLLIIRDRAPSEVFALDIQREAVELLKKSVEHNLEKGISRAGVIKPLLGDIKNIREIMPAGEQDVVICNPPYKLPGSGLTNPDEAKRTARHESECTLENICAAAKWLLRFGGRFVLCQRPERLTDVLSCMRENDLEPKRLRFVQGKLNKAPKLFLVEAKRGAKPGYMDVLPALIVEDERGFTAEMKRIYSSYKEGHNG